VTRVLLQTRFRDPAFRGFGPWRRFADQLHKPPAARLPEIAQTQEPADFLKGFRKAIPLVTDERSRAGLVLAVNCQAWRDYPARRERTYATVG
jgi:hypothetical protein